MLVLKPAAELRTLLSSWSLTNGVEWMWLKTEWATLQTPNLGNSRHHTHPFCTTTALFAQGTKTGLFGCISGPLLGPGTPSPLHDAAGAGSPLRFRTRHGDMCFHGNQVLAPPQFNVWTA